MEYINKLIQGHTPEVLKQLPDGSVHCVFTSSPYWSLRSYPNAEAIWDSVNGCLHEWGSENIQKQRGITKGVNATVGNQINEVCGTEIKQGQYCQKCGAWFGQLGLEPDYNLFIKHLCDIFDEFKRVLRERLILTWKG